MPRRFDRAPSIALATMHLDRSLARYTPCYCEENIWHLAQHDALAQYDRWIIFIANHRRACAFWCQRGAPDPQAPVVWDYHVVLAARIDGTTWIFDFDSTLDFPVAARSYLDHTFPVAARIPPPFTPLFRVIPADQFVARFASDRSHMREANGSFIKPPPPWPEIHTAQEQMNLDRFIDMRAEFIGAVLDLEGFGAWVGARSDRINGIEST